MHALGSNQRDVIGLASADIALAVVPLFHANGWSLAFSAPMAGASIIMPGMKLDGASLYELLDTYKVTCTAAVPTVWMGLLAHLEATGGTLPHLKRVVVGGSACPRAMTQKFQDVYGVPVIHAWGMTEMSPLGSVCSLKPEYAGLTGEAKLDIQQKQGHPPFLVEMTIEDDAGKPVPWDGKSFGRLKVRGAAVARAYFKAEGDDILDENGYFDTGDVATMDRYGYMQITDRSKDVIKSGGEWISSIELENLAIGHPKVAEAAVIGVRHPEMGRAAAPRHRPQGRRGRRQGGHPRLHAGQDRDLVAPRRRRLRRGDPPYRDRQDPEGHPAGALQGLPLADRGVGLTPAAQQRPRRAHGRDGKIPWTATHQVMASDGLWVEIGMPLPMLPIALGDIGLSAGEPAAA